MDIQIHGKQMEVGESLRAHVQRKIEDINAKYLNHSAFSNVTFSREGHGHPLTRAHIAIKLGRNIMINAEETAADPYAAFDGAAARAGKQLRRYKRRLRDHHEQQQKTMESESLKARDYTLATRAPQQDGQDVESLDEGEDAAQDPVVIAEMAARIETLTVSDAVMRLDLGNLTALLFRNASHDGISMVYRRPDGHVGWVDTEARMAAAGQKTRHG